MPQNGWWCVPGTPALWRQRQTDLCGFQGILGLYSVTMSERRWGFRISSGGPSNTFQSASTGSADWGQGFNLSPRYKSE